MELDLIGGLYAGAGGGLGFLVLWLLPFRRPVMPVNFLTFAVAVLVFITAGILAADRIINPPLNDIIAGFVAVLLGAFAADAFNKPKRGQ